MMQPVQKLKDLYFRVGVACLATVMFAMVFSVAFGQTSGTKGSPEHIRATTLAVDHESIIANAATTNDWPSYGLDYHETRFSKLTQITTSNVKELGLMWTYNLESVRGVEATPIVVDGIMYVTASWAVVHAIDTRTGKRLWTFDPETPREGGYKGCCDVVNRGVALHKGRVFVGAYDARLIALDAVTGQKIWEKDTRIDTGKPYTITGAPRVVKGKVLIGNGGAEYGVRGYISAYDAETGDLSWRWFAVPGDPSKPFEDASMEMAAKTWDPAGKWWINGGGGTMWDSIVYDPALNMVYVGTGNGSPWNHRQRSPAGGDNLFLSSIVALDADTGKYVWHYQETPGDSWDYTATQPLMIADLTIDGVLRKVIMHAPKNGFFFVVDRINGKFISAKNFVNVNWATGYDADGKPQVVALMRSRDEAYEIVPGALGAHNWHPMSFNPQTGLVYIPALTVASVMKENKEWEHNKVVPGLGNAGIGWNTGIISNSFPAKTTPFGRLVAWDPVKQQEAWRVEHTSPWNGGTLTTAGNLVFQGAADGRFVAYNAQTGEKLWESPTGTGIVAGPSTYMVDGKQYVSVAVGWGGVFGITRRSTEVDAPGTVFTFAIGGNAPLPKYAMIQQQNLISGITYNQDDVRPGQLLYTSYCGGCHGPVGGAKGGNVVNLGYVAPESITNLEAMVFNGPFTNKGMPDFTGKLKPDEVVKLRAFIASAADAIRARAAQPAAPPAAAAPTAPAAQKGPDK